MPGRNLERLRGIANWGEGEPEKRVTQGGKINRRGGRARERVRKGEKREKTLRNTKTRNEENIRRRPPGPEVADDREKDGKIPAKG